MDRDLEARDARHTSEVIHIYSLRGYSGFITPVSSCLAGTDSSSRCRRIRNDILSLVGGGRSGDSQSELSPGRACSCESPLLPIATQDELSSRSSYNPEPAKDCRNEGSHTTLTNALACRNEGFYTTLTNALACRNEGSHTTLTNSPDWPVGTRDPIQP